MQNEKVDPNGFDRIYGEIGIYRSHLDWIRNQSALRNLPESVLRVLADYRESLGKGRLLQWLDPGADYRILDNGCGVGYFMFQILDQFPALGLRFAGTELSRNGLRFLNERKKREGRQRILGVCADVRKLPFADGAFDAVLCSEVLDHTPEPWAVIQEMARVVRPSGKVLLTVPNGRAERFWDRLRSSGRGVLGEEELREDYFEQFLSLTDVRTWIRDAGLLIRREELNTAIPLGTFVRRFPRTLQLTVARFLRGLEPFLRFELLATNCVLWAQKKALEPQPQR